MVNDSLVLVDFINKRRDSGMAVDDAIIEAARLRLRPIFLTSVTTIAGLAPLAIGVDRRSELLAPMATAISWGLTFSTVLILVIVPCLYRTVDGIGGGLSRLFAPLGRLATGEKKAKQPEPDLGALPEPAESSPARDSDSADGSPSRHSRQRAGQALIVADAPPHGGSKAAKTRWDVPRSGRFKTTSTRFFQDPPPH